MKLTGPDREPAERRGTEIEKFMGERKTNAVGSELNARLGRAQSSGAPSTRRAWV